MLNRSDYGWKELQQREAVRRFQYTDFWDPQQVIVKPASSMLGYSDEESVPMNADHHNVCKYTSPDDPNYRKVKVVLQKMLANCAARNRNHHNQQTLASSTGSLLSSPLQHGMMTVQAMENHGGLMVENGRFLETHAVGGGAPLVDVTAASSSSNASSIPRSRRGSSYGDSVELGPRRMQTLVVVGHTEM